MNAQDFKPVYAENNPNWRIVYMPGGTWTLQEYKPHPPGTVKKQYSSVPGKKFRAPDLVDWVDHNANMAFDAAKQLLATRNKMKK